MNLKEFRINCEAKKIPIIRPQTESLIVEKLKKINPQQILELGMAVGYSSTIWAKNTNAKIRCIELDEKNLAIAQKNHQMLNVLNVEMINIDAKEYSCNEKFDVIFVDAGKSWYQDYYNKYKNNLTPKGIMIFDNVDYHGLLKTNFRKHRTIVRKMNEFHDFINLQTDFFVKWYEVEDGVLIIGKNENYL